MDDVRQTTVSIAAGLTTGDSIPAQIVKNRQYMLAVGGTFDGCMVEIWANLCGVPFHLTTFEGPAAVLMWLPRSTVFARIVDPGAGTRVDVGAAPLVTRINNRRQIPRELWGKSAGQPLPMR